VNHHAHNCHFIDSNDVFLDCNTNNYNNPKGATLKALLIQSGEPISKYDSQGKKTKEPTATLSSTPDMYQVSLFLLSSCSSLSPSSLFGHQGFGRVSLKNILPYPGIEDNLQIVIDESSISAGYRITYTVQVTSATLPFKVTLAWMDPMNSVITSKMLLNDLDLQIREVSTSSISYGNGIQGDEDNNVSNAKISFPPSHHVARLNKSLWLFLTSGPMRSL
jgi:hypothetical protein